MPASENRQAAPVLFEAWPPGDLSATRICPSSDHLTDVRAMGRDQTLAKVGLMRAQKTFLVALLGILLAVIVGGSARADDSPQSATFLKDPTMRQTIDKWRRQVGCHRLESSLNGSIQRRDEAHRVEADGI
jgi:hypothetical protein